MEMNAYHADEISLLNKDQIANCTLWVAESFQDLDKGHIFGETAPYETYCAGNQRGRLFRDMQREYGRCASTVYAETAGKTVPVGWYFESKQPYTDTGKPYLRGVWVHVFYVPNAA
jgi:hypothetical protein